MREVDIKELVDVGQRTALLLGEITGRLLMFVNAAQYNNDEIPMQDVSDLLIMMQDRITDIYYNNKEAVNERV